MYICHNFFLYIYFFLLYFLFFNFTILYWFCHISTWIRHRYTRVPHPEPSSLPLPSLWVIPQFLYPCILQRHLDCFLSLAIVNNGVKYTHRKPSNYVKKCLCWSHWQQQSFHCVPVHGNIMLHSNTSNSYFLHFSK